ncbi:NAD-dependent epimerase/dehydratase family protein [Nocardioides halotolerans]|uniref:NAD-dependent epimerase/dehydratase family protein n=1 Tax=Nocardioides halotolerans TaxID=433660 RepID=UPI0003F9CD53|nr:NAD(P)-dependent oxidoreductase [Nocardioides halotolerans]
MRVLLTGAAGSIGQVLSVGLADRGHEVVGLDLVPQPDGLDDGWHTADCADPDAVADVFEAEFAESSLDAVVHMAGHPGEQSLPDSLTSHVVTTAALLDAMVEHGVRRLVYGGSNHAVGYTPRAGLADGLLPVETRLRPDTFYGVAKAGAEALMSLYADRHGLDVVSCRIGSFRAEPATVRHLATWLSHDDCVRMVDAALTTPAPGFAAIYGISRNTRRWWDLAPGHALGYDPVDDAEGWADRVEPRPDDADENAVVGGEYALPSHERPAFDRA